MKIRLLTILAILLFPLASFAQQPEDNLPEPVQIARLNAINIGGGVTASGPTPVAVSENWNCDNSTDPDCQLDWTELGAGGVQIYSNYLLMDNAGYLINGVILTGSLLDGGAGYVKITPTFASTYEYLNIVIRWTDSDSPHYVIGFSITEQNWFWNYMSALDTGEHAIDGPDSLTFSSENPIGITWTGTGASTRIRVWVNPTGLPSTALVWNGDDTPTATFDAAPGEYEVDSGVYVGIFQFGSGNSYVDDFYAGDL